MSKKIGSQTIEMLKDTDYILVTRGKGYIVLLDTSIPNASAELWVLRNHYAGYVIQVGRWRYELVRTIKDLSEIEYLNA